MIRVYLDNCSFNRPYDEQVFLKIRLETQAKLKIQELISDRKIELVWSFVMSYENAMNPFVEKRTQIAKWRKIAAIDCGLNDVIVAKSEELMKRGLSVKDSYHVACAIFTKADYFITTDTGILNKRISEVKVINPVQFIFLTEGSI